MDFAAGERSIFVVGSFVTACSVRVDRLPRPGESLLAESFTLEAGGKGFNMAVAARRLGARVDGVFAVGDDPFADFARDAIEQAGLSAHMLVPFSGPTGTGVGFVDARGENCIAVCPAANALLSADVIRSAAARVTRAALVLAQFEVRDEPIAEAFAQTRASGGTTILNPSPFRPIAPEILRHADIVVVNRTEAAALLAQLDPSREQAEPIDRAGCALLARLVLGAGTELLVVTLGDEGLWAWTQAGDVLRQPAFPVRAVDTIGAGDACLGGIAAGLSFGLALPEALRWGAACGAMATTRPGLLAALPTPGILAQFLSDHAPAP